MSSAILTIASSTSAPAFSAQSSASSRAFRTNLIASTASRSSASTAFAAWVITQSRISPILRPASMMPVIIRRSRKYVPLAASSRSWPSLMPAAMAASTNRRAVL